MEERGEAKRLRAGELVGERLGEGRGHPRRELPERRLGIALDLERLAEHVDRVPVHVEVVVRALLHPAEVLQLRENGRDKAQPLGELQPFDHAVGDHDAAELREHAFRGGGRDAGGSLARQALGLGLGLEVELGGEPREAERPQRIAGVRRGGDVRSAEHAQDAVLEVGRAAARVDQPGLTVLKRHRQRVDAEVAQRKVPLDRRRLQSRDVADPLPSPADRPPGPERLRQLEGRTTRHAGHGPRRLLRGAVDGDVHVADLAAEQRVPDGSAHEPGRRSERGEGAAHGADRRRRHQPVESGAHPAS